MSENCAQPLSYLMQASTHHSKYHPPHHPQGRTLGIWKQQLWEHAVLFSAHGLFSPLPFNKLYNFYPTFFPLIHPHTPVVSTKQQKSSEFFRKSWSSIQKKIKCQTAEHRNQRARMRMVNIGHTENCLMVEAVRVAADKNTRKQCNDMCDIWYILKKPHSSNHSFWFLSGIRNVFFSFMKFKIPTSYTLIFSLWFLNSSVSFLQILYFHLSYYSFLDLKLQLQKKKILQVLPNHIHLKII